MIWSNGEEIGMFSEAGRQSIWILMQTPDKIKVGYRNYKLEEWKQTVASANEAQGQFFSKEGVSHANTILHEIIHGIIYQWNIDVGEKEEF